MEKILTIGIPTYNRKKQLTNCLDRICPLITGEVQVLVIDNGSENYDFMEFIKPYVDKYGVKAYRNKKNVGIDANQAKVFEMCDTKWLWMLGDDDFIMENAIAEVLKIVKQNNNAIYINLNSNFVGTVSGIKGFAEAMKSKWAYGHSFFISECLHNIEAASGDIYWHYRYLSSYTGQILRVMKHLIDSPNSECVFTDTKVLDNHSQDISWSHIDFVFYQHIIYDIFREQRSILKSNVFRSVLSICFRYIDESDLCLSEKIHYYRMYLRKHGYINALRYNKLDLLRSILFLILGKNGYRKIVRS